MNNQELAKILGIDKKGKPTIVFTKTNFHPEKVGATPIFNRMFYNANFKSEIIRINNDIKTAFTNLMKIGVHKNEIPMLSATLFNQLMITIDKGNKEFLRDDSAPEFTRKELQKISETQAKIYKVLFKIEEDLIDEQDTEIKDRNEGLMEKIQKLLDERDARLKEELLKDMEGRFAGYEASTTKSILDTVLKIYAWYRIISTSIAIASGTWKAGKWVKDKIKWLRQSRVERLQSEIERQRNIQREAEERIRRAEERLGRTSVDTERARAESERLRTETERLRVEAEQARAESERLRAETERLRTEAEHARAEAERARARPPQRPVPNPEAPTTTEARAGRPPSNAARRFPRLAKMFGTFMKTVGPVLGKAMIVLDVFILLPMKICEFWDLSMKPESQGGHLDFNFIERAAYSIAAGLTQWVEDHLRIVEDLAKLFKLIIDFVAKNFAEMAKDGGEMMHILAEVASAISFGVGKLIEKVISPITQDLIDTIKKYTGAACGDYAGMCAVMMVNDIWDELTSLVRGSVPNDTTYQLLTGENTVLNDLQKRGIYTWNKFGESELRYQNVSDIASKLTKAEIMAILAHDDTSTHIKRTLKDALKYKNEHNITDIDVYKNIYTSVYLTTLITDLGYSSGALEKQWLKMIQGSVDQSRNFLIRYGWISAECNAKDQTVKVLEKGAFPSDKEAEAMFKYVFSRLKGQCTLLGIWTLPYETLYFDVFGTIMNSGFTSVPPGKVVNPANSKQYLKVIGYLDKQRQFHEGKSCPDDEIFDAVLKKDKYASGIYNDNILVDEVVASASSGKISQSDVAGVASLPTHLMMTTGAGSSLPSHLMMTTSLGASDGNRAVPSSVPTHLAMTAGSGLPEHLASTEGFQTTETFNVSGSESLPSHLMMTTGNQSAPTQSYSGSDYTSVEAIRAAKIFKGQDGKWHSDNPLVDAIMQIESNGNPNAVNSHTLAAGLFQFVPKYAPAYFMRGNKDIPGYKYKPGDRRDPFLSLNAFKEFAIENVKGMKKRGIPVNAMHLYMCHQQGLGGFSNLYRIVTGGGALTPKAKEALRQNSLVKGKDADNPKLWYQNWVNHFNKKLKQAGGASVATVAATLPGPNNQSAAGSSGALSPSAHSGSSGYASQPAPPGQSSYSPQPEPQNNKASGMIAAARYARSHAKEGTTGKCAHYVANALEYAGLKFDRQVSAYMYHTNGVLSKAGFGLVSKGMSGYTPQVGDISVTDRFKSHEHGHICIFDGKNWISDFVQNSPNVYKDGPGPMYFYRYGGPDLVVNDTAGAAESYPVTNQESYSENPVSSPETESRVHQNALQKDKTPPEQEGDTEAIFIISASTILEGIV